MRLPPLRLDRRAWGAPGPLAVAPGGATPGLLALALAWAAGSALAQTPARLGPNARVGTVIEETVGDRACYLTLRDDAGRRWETLAVFTLCDDPPVLRGRRVELHFGLARVIAADCQGDPDCPRTERVRLAVAARPLPPLPAAAASAKP